MKKSNTQEIKKQARLGKYILKHRLGIGGYGTVWKAEDTIEGIHVALKIPFEQFTDERSLEDFRREARVLAKLDHPHILRIKSAEFLEGHFVIAQELGRGTLQDRIERALPLKKAYFYFDQVLEALAYAHHERVIHRDVKPDNFIIFSGDHLRLGDFGIAQILAKKQMTSTVSGTLGFMAPEQAYGQPGKSSDVFSAGLIFYTMLTGKTPTWPFEWPFVASDMVRRKGGAPLERFIRKACSFYPRDRFLDAIEMLDAYEAMKEQIATQENRKLNSKKTKRKRRKPKIHEVEWPELRKKEFAKKFGKSLNLHFFCARCNGPISESMTYCPWCRYDKNTFTEISQFPDTCEGCKKGVYPEWRYCAWCFGPQFKEVKEHSNRHFEVDRICSNTQCKGPLSTFMRYCPWCRKKVSKPWKCEPLLDRCPKCSWSVDGSFWDDCPWCGTDLKRS